MFYWFLKFFMNFGLRAFFLRVYLSGAENIPKNKPVILASNHPNSFLDAIILGTLLRRPVHFLARGDVFNTPFKKWLLWQIKMLPIYRLEEGVENLHKNEETFDRCKQVLEKNGIILIFSEGLCIVERRLRKLRKGTARIAFTTEETSNWGLDIQIIPVGMNYTHPTKPRKELMITLGKPFPVARFKNQYEENQAVAIRQFNELLAERLRELVVHVADKSRDKIAENLLEIHRNNGTKTRFPWIRSSDEMRISEWKLVERLNALDDADLGKLRFNLEGYWEQLEKYKLSDQDLSQPLKQPLLVFVGLFLSLPITLLGYFLNIWPWQLSVSLTKKVVRSNVFQASVNLGSAFFLYLIWYIVLFSIGSSVSTPFRWALFASPLLGYFAIVWTEAFYRWVANNKVKNLKNNSEQLFEDLKTQRANIVKQL